MEKGAVDGCQQESERAKKKKIQRVNNTKDKKTKLWHIPNLLSYTKIDMHVDRFLFIELNSKQFNSCISKSIPVTVLFELPKH